MRIYELSKKWSAEEKFSLTDQIRRSSRSVCSNIAEAWRKRRYQAHFVSKLSDADTEAAETEVWLDFALRCGCLSETEHGQLRDHYDYICRMLTKMMAAPESWCKSVARDATSGKRGASGERKAESGKRKAESGKRN